jgi:HSP20 family molecular chaperone IbpA
LPERADVEKIKADLDEGVLKVQIPLEPLPVPKKISISSKKPKIG